MNLDRSALDMGVWRKPSMPVNSQDMSSDSLCSPEICRYSPLPHMYSDTEYTSSFSAASVENLYRSEAFGPARMNLDNRALGSLGLENNTLDRGVWRTSNETMSSNSSLRSFLDETYNSYAHYFAPQYNSSFYSLSEPSSNPESYVNCDTTNSRLPRKITKRSDSSESSNELTMSSKNFKTASRPTSDSNPSTYNIWENPYFSPRESDLNEQLRIHNMLNPDSNIHHNSTDHLLESSNSDHEDLSSTFCQILQNHYFPELTHFNLSSSSSELISNIAKTNHVWKNHTIPSHSNNSSYAQERFMRNESFPFSDQTINLFNTPDKQHSTPQKSFYSRTSSHENMFQITEPSYAPTTMPQRSLTFHQSQYPSAKTHNLWKNHTFPSAQISNHSSDANEQFMRNEHFPFSDHSINDLFHTPDIRHSTPQKSFYSPTSSHENMYQIAEPSYAPTTMAQRSLAFHQSQYPSKRQVPIGLHNESTPLLENLNRRGLKKMMKADSSDWCNFCMKNGESMQIYSKHSLKERRGKKLVVTCPILRSFVCSTCNATGDNAHTETYCPVLMSRNNGQRIKSTTVTVKSTRTKSNGQRRY